MVSELLVSRTSLRPSSVHQPPVSTILNAYYSTLETFQPRNNFNCFVVQTSEIFSRLGIYLSAKWEKRRCCGKPECLSNCHIFLPISFDCFNQVIIIVHIVIYFVYCFIIKLSNKKLSSELCVILCLGLFLYCGWFTS